MLRELKWLGHIFNLYAMGLCLTNKPIIFQFGPGRGGASEQTPPTTSDQPKMVSFYNLGEVGG